MNKIEFDNQFEKIVIEPLKQIGFQEEGKSLFLNDGSIAVSLIRLGGKFSVSGTIAHVICFRHSFLPNLDEKIPDGFEGEVFAYPYKWQPKEIISFLKKPFVYKSKNLNYDYERFIYSEKSENEINKYLNNLHKAVVKVVEWAKSTRVDKIADQIKERGESAWIEKLWLSAYSAQKTI